MHLNNSKFEPNLQISIWLISLTIMTFLIIIIGGLTRLTDSGLSMVDWRPIMGTLPPITHSDWVKVFNDYQLTPEFQIVNKSMNLEDFKYIFWWEWFHRFFARCIGFVFIFPFLYFLFLKKISKKLFLTLSIVFIFGLIQAIVGWWMVKSGLTENPYVSPYRLTFHLSNALIIYSILLWSTFSSFSKKEKYNKFDNEINKYLIFGLLLIFLTILSGGFMAGTDAGNSYNTFPLMNEKIIPDDYYLEDYKWLNFFENTVAVNFNHRWLATITFIYIVAFTVYFIIFSKLKIDKLSLNLVIFFVCLQFLLGILTLINNVPILLASMHQTNSTLLLSSLLFAYHRHKYSSQDTLRDK